MQLKRVVAPLGLVVIVAGVVLVVGNRVGFWQVPPLAGVVTIFLGFVLNHFGRAP